MAVWRWVEMPVQAEHASTVRQLLFAQAPHTRAFPGCEYLRLYEGEGPTFYSLSRWSTPEALEKYRSSTLFRSFWAQLKPYFRSPAQALTLRDLGEFR